MKGRHMGYKRWRYTLKRLGGVTMKKYISNRKCTFGTNKEGNV
jgi:hypothetical protein